VQQEYWKLLFKLDVMKYLDFHILLLTLLKMSADLLRFIETADDGSGVLFLFQSEFIFIQKSLEPMEKPKQSY